MEPSYSRQECETLANMVKASEPAQQPQHSSLPLELDSTDWPLIINGNELGESNVVAIVECQEANGRNYSYPEHIALANAKLIVASVNHANKLAEALQGTLNWLTSYEGGAAIPAYDKARQALSEYQNAKGGTSSE